MIKKVYHICFFISRNIALTHDVLKREVPTHYIVDQHPSKTVKILYKLKNLKKTNIFKILKHENQLCEKSCFLWHFLTHVPVIMVMFLGHVKTEQARKRLEHNS